jgi:hypothetical protein
LSLGQLEQMPSPTPMTAISEKIAEEIVAGGTTHWIDRTFRLRHDRMEAWIWIRARAEIRESQ